MTDPKKPERKAKATFGDIYTGARKSGEREQERPRKKREERVAAPKMLEKAPPELSGAAAPVDEGGDFAAMLEESLASRAPARLREGQRISGTVIQVGEEVAFVSLGGKGEGQIDLAEFRGEDGSLSVKAGDALEAFVVSAGGPQGVVLSRGLKRGAADAIREAAATGVPVEGVVKAVNKGGLEVDLGGTRGFCPVSQIDVRFVEDPAQFVGQRLSFRVTEVRGRDVVLSRRALLAEERQRRAAETRTRLSAGERFQGRVVSVREFGAFVDIGGIEGLVPNRELPIGRSLAVGDEVEVEVLKIEPDEKKGERVTLSARAAEAAMGAPMNSIQGAPVPRQEDPTASALSQAKLGATRGLPAIAGDHKSVAPSIGAVLDATVDRVEPYGVFVKFTAGKGLVPASELGVPRGADLRKQFPPGTPLRVAVLEIDEKGRYRLSAEAAARAEERAEAEAYIRSQRPPSGRGFGTLGDLLKKTRR